MSLFFLLAAERIPDAAGQTGSKNSTGEAPALFTNLRRVILLSSCPSVSVAVSKNEIHKVSQILVGQPFLQPFRHER